VAGVGGRPGGGQPGGVGRRPVRASGAGGWPAGQRCVRSGVQWWHARSGGWRCEIEFDWWTMPHGAGKIQ
jgi:hypothetical protein